MAKYKNFLMTMTCAAVLGCYAGSEAPVETGTQAQDADTQAAAKDPVALVAFGDVDPALMDRVQKWTSHNLAMPVPVFPAEPNLHLDSFQEVLDAAVKMLPDKQLGLVVIWRPATRDVQNHGAVFPEKRIAIANLNPMFTPDTDPEKIERRVERQAIRGICMVMGIEPSPNPMSAMYNYSSLEELDKIGRNLDLPWLVRVQEKALEAGIELTPGSPFNVMN